MLILIRILMLILNDLNDTSFLVCWYWMIWTTRRFLFIEWLEQHVVSICTEWFWMTFRFSSSNVEWFEWHVVFCLLIYCTENSNDTSFFVCWYFASNDLNDTSFLVCWYFTLNDSNCTSFLVYEHWFWFERHVVHEFFEWFEQHVVHDSQTHCIFWFERHVVSDLLTHCIDWFERHVVQNLH